MTDRELIQQALDALEKLNKDGWILADFEDEVYASIEALRARLSQPEPEPVAWMYNGNLHEFDPSDWAEGEVIPLYTAPPQREWQGLTNEEIMDACSAVWASHPIEVGQVVEAKLKEKNGF